MVRNSLPLGGLRPAHRPEAAADVEGTARTNLAPADRARESRAETARRLIATIPAQLRSSLGALPGLRRAHTAPPIAQATPAPDDGGPSQPVGSRTLGRLSRGDSVQPVATAHAGLEPESAAAVLDEALQVMGLHRLPPHLIPLVNLQAHDHLRQVLRSESAEAGPRTRTSADDIRRIALHALLLVACRQSLGISADTEDGTRDVALLVSQYVVDLAVEILDEPDLQDAQELGQICQVAMEKYPRIGESFPDQLVEVRFRMFIEDEIHYMNAIRHLF